MMILEEAPKNQQYKNRLNQNEVFQLPNKERIERLNSFIYLRYWLECAHHQNAIHISPQMAGNKKQFQLQWAKCCCGNSIAKGFRRAKLLIKSINVYSWLIDIPPVSIFRVLPSSSPLSAPPSTSSCLVELQGLA